MEYLNGGDLYSLLRKVGCFEENVARSYIAELVCLNLFRRHTLSFLSNFVSSTSSYISGSCFGIPAFSWNRAPGFETRQCIDCT